MEQVEVKFYIKGKRKPIQIIIFESKERAKEFLEHMYDKEICMLNDVAISISEFRYAKLKVL